MLYTNVNYCRRKAGASLPTKLRAVFGVRRQRLREADADPPDFIDFSL
jgi:hypothetical protein